MPARAPPKPRDQILAAAARVLVKKGLVATSTRAIAREAGCADGAIFYHFKTRLDLFVQLLIESTGGMSDALDSLPLRVGEGALADNLCDAIAGLHEFHIRAVPVLASLFAEPKLMQRYREALKQSGRGPHLSVDRIAAYLRAEQRLGRVAAGRDVYMIAVTLQSVSFQEAFRQGFFNEKSDRTWIAKCIHELVGDSRAAEPK